MKIAVIAANGRSGQAFVREALAAGHTIRAGIRSSNPFEDTAGVNAITCDATNRDDVLKLIDSADAVVSLIGHVKGSDDFVQTKATKVMIEAMNGAGVTRLVSLTGAGVWVPGDPFGKSIKWLNAVSAKLGVKRFNDGIAHANVLAKSSLDWSIVRVLMLTNGEPGPYKLKPHGIVKVPTPRREVARAIIELLENASFVRDYPIMGRL